MVVVSGTSNKGFAKELAKALGKRYVDSDIHHFPDGELHVKVPGGKIDREGIIVQSLAYRPNEYILELILLADDLRREGAKKVIAVIPYLAYARQDEEFTKGEAVAFLSVAKLLETYCDKIITVDTHLHRFHRISQVFSKAVNVSAMEELAQYAKKRYKNLKNPLIIGPDGESKQWAKQIAGIMECEYDIFEKVRLSATKVIVKPKKKDLRGRDIIIVDDIISTGGTIIETIKIAKKQGAKRIIVFCSHGLLMDGALKRILRAGAEVVVSTNTVPNSTSKVSAVPSVARVLKGKVK
ncbi:MAG: ribose-phosphate diphosphokinase [Candidatus Altiarchaeota archaeon]|nr:ribose-phosphate diphosphokinase [Candidatus Altiarchaeota archaeon]